MYPRRNVSKFWRLLGATAFTTWRQFVSLEKCNGFHFNLPTSRSRCRTSCCVFKVPNWLSCDRRKFSQSEESIKYVNYHSSWQSTSQSTYITRWIWRRWLLQSKRAPTQMLFSWSNPGVKSSTRLVNYSLRPKKRVSINTKVRKIKNRKIRHTDCNKITAIATMVGRIKAVPWKNIKLDRVNEKTAALVLLWELMILWKSR